MKKEFSVLMSVYYKERPDYLAMSLDSLINQSLMPSEIIIVEDGKLTNELYSVIDDYRAKYPQLKPIQLPANVGLGPALNEGMKHCSYDWIARMDSDDYSIPERFEKQFEYIEKHPHYDVYGCWIEEFYDDIDNVVSIRKTPELDVEIKKHGVSRNPINHVTVVFKKESVNSVGGYQKFNGFEDYYLWTRMIMSGKTFHNLPISLVKVRISRDMFKRRGGIKYLATEARFQKALHNMGYIGTSSMLKNIGVRWGVRLIPNFVRKWIYLGVLRESAQ